jgi:hypothetical protein
MDIRTHGSTVVLLEGVGTTDHSLDGGTMTDFTRYKRLADEVRATLARL